MTFEVEITCCVAGRVWVEADSEADARQKVLDHSWKDAELSKASAHEIRILSANNITQEVGNHFAENEL